MGFKSPNTSYNRTVQFHLYWNFAVIHMTENNSKMKVVYKGQISNRSFFFIPLLQISLEYSPYVGYSERFLGKIEEFQISA